jgi:carbonic anhydrase/acetyltransferase-like protein (isoleucine patch superfamily)
LSIRSFEGREPRLATGAWVADTALVIGDVELGESVSIWPTAIVRGDIQSIRIGARSNVQDGTVIHVTHDSRFCPGGLPTIVGAGVTIGHRAVLHACSVGDQALIGMQATVLDGVVVGARCMVGAGSLVPPGKRLDPGWLYVGNPVVRRRPLSDLELEFLGYSAENYVRLKDRYVSNECR